MESFAKTYNQIKRVDENEISGSPMYEANYDSLLSKSIMAGVKSSVKEIDGLDMGELGRQERSAQYGIDPYQEQPELSDLGQLTPEQEEMKGYISKHVNSELELNHEMSNYINQGYQGLSDGVKQGLRTDMDYITYVEIKKDEEQFRREKGF